MVTQYYGIKYPFSNDNEDGIYLDLNKTYTEKVKSDILHVLFTPKGQRLRMPEFGTDLIKCLFEPSDSISFNEIKNTIIQDVCRYVKDININNISIEPDPNDENHVIVIVDYVVTQNGINEQTTVGVRL